MINYTLKIIIKCLLCTIIIEFSIAFILKVRNKLDLINILIVNIITNPLVVMVPLYINIRFGLTPRNVVLLIMEIATIIFEGHIYKKYLSFKKINPYILSTILNASSYFIGLIINSFI